MMPLIEYSIQDVLMDMFRKWCAENGREPKYFVIHPDDYSHIYKQIISASAYQVDYKIMGLPILVSDIIPQGQYEFVG